MGSRSHDRLRPKTAGGMSRGVDLRKSGECRIRARIAIGRKHAGEMNSRSAYVGEIQLYRAKIVIKPGRIRTDVAVAEIAGDHAGRNQLDLIARSERVEIILKPLPVDRG